MDNRNVAIGLAGIRIIGIGAALVVAPTFAGRMWVGPGADEVAPTGGGSNNDARPSSAAAIAS